MELVTGGPGVLGLSGKAPLGQTGNFTGELDHTTREHLDRTLESLATANPATIDLTEVTYADSSLVNSVARMLRKRPASLRDEPIRIIGACLVVRRIFQVTGLDKFVCFYDSMSDAQAGLERGGFGFLNSRSGSAKWMALQS
jgi:anti-anti-sigma factor